MKIIEAKEGYTLFVAIYPLKDLHNDIHRDDTLLVYRTQIYSPFLLKEMTDHLILTNTKLSSDNIICRIETILCKDNQFYDNDVRLSHINYKRGSIDYIRPEKPLSENVNDFICFDTVNEWREKQYSFYAGDIK